MPRFGTIRFGTDRFGSYSRIGLVTPAGKIPFGAGGFTARNMTVNGVVIRGKDMLPNQALIKALGSHISSYELKLFIQDNVGNWIDFSDRTNVGGRNQLLKIGKISHHAESIHGNIRQRVSNIHLDNSDGFWSKPFPPNLYASFNSDWDWLGDRSVTASFSYSENRQRTVLYRHRVAIRANVHVVGDDVPMDVTLGVFLIDSVGINGSSHSAELRVTSLEFPLAEADAKKIKDGLNWYENRPVSFLVQELVKSVYTDTNGELPYTYDIEDIVQYPVPNIDGNGWAVSHFGRPPERVFRRSGGGFASTSQWNKESNVCRAMVAHEISNGTLSVTAGSNIVMVSTGYIQGGHDIKAGDVLVIPRQFTEGDGGSTQHFGYYEVESADNEEGEIALVNNVRGSTDESGLKWCVYRIYMGIGNNLYYFNQATDTYYQLNADNAISSDLEIRRLWYNPNDSTYPIWGVAMTRCGNGEVGYDMLIFRFGWDGANPNFDIWRTTRTTHVLLGENVQWKPKDHGESFEPNPRHYIGRWGGISGSTERPPLPILFDQFIASQNNNPVMIHKNLTFIDNIDSINDDETQLIVGANAGLVGQGQYSAGYYQTDDGGPGAVRFSLGQDGFLEFHPSWGTNGCIIFAQHETSGGEPVSEGGYNDDEYYSYTFRYFDLSDDSTDYALPMGTYWDSVKSVSELAVPVCCCTSSGGGFYFALFFKGTSSYSSWIFRKESLSGDAALIFDGSSSPTDESNKIPIEMHYIDGRLYIVLAIVNQSNSFYEVAVISNLYTTYGGSNPMPRKSASNLPVRPWGLTPIEVYNPSTEANETKIFFMESTSGRLRYYNSSGDQETGPAIVETSGFMSDETFAFSNVLGSTNTMELFWISSPYPTHTLPSRMEGRFYLNRWGYFVPARVELADFDEMKVYESISHLAEKVDALFGFYPDGNFFFKIKPSHISSEYTFTNVGENKIAEIAVDDGYSEIVNSATRTPSRVTIPPVEVMFDLSPESKYDKHSTRHSIDVYQARMESRQIKLTCVSGGRTSEATASDDPTPKKTAAQFAWELVEGNISSSLTQDYARGSLVIYIDGEHEIPYAASVRVVGENQQDVVNLEEQIDDVSGTSRVGYILRQSNTEMELSADIDEDSSIIPLQLVGGYVVNLSQSLNNGYTVAPGSIIAIGNFASGTNIEYAQVVGVSGESLQVNRSLGLQRGTSVAHSQGEQVALINHGNALFLRHGDDLSENYDSGFTGYPLFVIGDEVALDLPQYGTSSTFTVNPNGTSSTLHPDRLFTPVDGHFIQVGGDGTPYSTGVYLKFSFNGPRSIEPKFRQGDIVRINVPGISLSKDATITHSYSDMASIRKYGKRDSRTGDDNPFLSDNEARWAVRRDVQDNRHPKYTFQILSIIVPWLLPTAVITVQSPEHLPNASEHKEICYVASVGYSPQTDGLMEVVARAKDPY